MIVEFNKTIDKLMETIDFLEEDNEISIDKSIEYLEQLEKMKKEVNA